jgi:Flp pilus assembly protein TadD
MATNTAPQSAGPATTGVPRDILDLVKEGKAALERGDLEQALASFEKVVDEYPARAEGHNNLGALYTSLGQYEKAEACFGKVVDLLPENDNVRYNRGIVRIRLQRWQAAIEDFNTVLASQPDDADCWNNLGVATFLAGDHETSRAHFERALELMPDFPNALLNLCDAETASGRTGHAVELCRRFLAERDDPEVVRKQLELIAAGMRELAEEGCEIAEGILREDAGDTETRLLLGRLLEAREALAAAAGTG